MLKEMNTVVSDYAVAPGGEGQGGPAYSTRSVKELAPRGRTGECAKAPGAGPKEGREMD